MFLFVVFFLIKLKIKEKETLKFKLMGKTLWMSMVNPTLPSQHKNKG
jgi:hypothetical protein